jgi:hypothetical protein
MHIKVASVCWQGRKVEAQKSIIMKFIEKPGEFIWKHREDRIVAQFPCMTMLDLSIIIKSPVLAPAHLSGLNTPPGGGRRGRADSAERRSCISPSQGQSSMLSHHLHFGKAAPHPCGVPLHHPCVDETSQEAAL